MTVLMWVFTSGILYKRDSKSLYKKKWQPLETHQAVGVARRTSSVNATTTCQPFFVDSKTPFLRLCHLYFNHDWISHNDKHHIQYHWITVLLKANDCAGNIYPSHAIKWSSCFYLLVVCEKKPLVWMTKRNKRENGKGLNGSLNAPVAWLVESVNSINLCVCDCYPCGLSAALVDLKPEQHHKVQWDRVKNECNATA